MSKRQVILRTGSIIWLLITASLFLYSFDLAKTEGTVTYETAGTSAQSVFRKEQDSVLVIDKADAEAVLHPDTETVTVNTEYIFSNPSSTRQEATLFFPVQLPEYADQYRILVNGEEAETAERLSSVTGVSGYRSISELFPEFTEDGFYSPETPVTRYHFAISGIPEEQENSYGWLSFPQLLGQKDTRLFLRMDSAQFSSPQEVRFPAENGMEFDMYVLGSDDLRSYKAGIYFWNEDWTHMNIGEGVIEILEKENIFFTKMLEVTGILPADRDIQSFCGLLNRQTEVLPDSVWMQFPEPEEAGERIVFLEYRITLDPGETVTNNIIQPIRPAVINNGGRYETQIRFDFAALERWERNALFKASVQTDEHFMKDESNAWISEEGTEFTAFGGGLNGNVIRFTFGSEEAAAWEKKVSRLKAIYRSAAFLSVLIVLYRIVRPSASSERKKGNGKAVFIAAGLYFLLLILTGGSRQRGAAAAYALWFFGAFFVFLKDPGHDRLYLFLLSVTAIYLVSRNLRPLFALFGGSWAGGCQEVADSLLLPLTVLLDKAGRRIPYAETAAVLLWTMTMIRTVRRLSSGEGQ